MYNLAIINTQEYSVPESLNLRSFYFLDEKHLFQQVDTIHGVIIYQEKGEELSANLELILSIKRRSSLPIWIIDETKNRMNRKLMLDLGAVGVLDSSFSDEEISILIKNTMELIYSRSVKNHSERTKKAGFQLNTQNHSIQVPNKVEISLTHLEYKILTLLATRVNQAFTYEDIHATVWGKEREVEFIEQKYHIANTVFHIRDKLKRHGLNPNILRTVRSVGYLLDATIEIDPNERGGWQLLKNERESKREVR